MIDPKPLRPVWLAAVLALGGAAPAPSGPAAIASAWFMRSCVRFAAHPKALRRWAAAKHLPKAPAKAAETYLFGLPGQVFTIPTAARPLLLVSEDSGLCSVIGSHVRGPALLDRVNAALTAAGVTFTVTQDGPDPKAKALHDRAYTARKGSAEWLMLVSTVTDPAGGEAILTSTP
ncbi:MAG: NMCC_0638 family (lipo)protein [Acetobacteraceae bacterium]